MAAEVMDFDCEMKSNGSTESKLELRLNRRIGRALTVMELCFVSFEEVCSQDIYRAEKGAAERVMWKINSL